MTTVKTGRLISFEGIDGCGKSTQASLLMRRLEALYGKDAVLLTHEPGGWSGGDVVRNLLLRAKTMSSLGELFLFAADRCEHVREVIRPALARGVWVLCERFLDSTVAYQVYGRGIPPEYVATIGAWASFPQPDMTLYYDISLDLAMERRRNRAHADRFESEHRSFLERVNGGYRELQRRYPSRIVRLDASAGVTEVAEMTWRAVSQRFRL